MDGGLDQRFHHQEHVGWPGAAHGGGHVEGVLILDVDLLAQSLQNGPGLGMLFLRHLWGACPHAHPLAHLGRGVRHDPHDSPMPQPPRDGFGARSGHDGEGELVEADEVVQIVQHER